MTLFDSKNREWRSCPTGLFPLLRSIALHYTNALKRFLSVYDLIGKEDKASNERASAKMTINLVNIRETWQQKVILFEKAVPAAKGLSSKFRGSLNREVVPTKPKRKSLDSRRAEQPSQKKQKENSRGENTSTPSNDHRKKDKGKRKVPDDFDAGSQLLF